MDRKASLDSIKGKLAAGSPWRGRLIKLAAVGLAVGLSLPLAPEVMRQIKFLTGANAHRGPAGAHGAKGGVVEQARDTFEQAYDQTLGTMTEKLKALQQAEARSHWLALENANLRAEIERLKYGGKIEDNSKRTKKISLKITQEVGSRVGRSLAGIDFAPPQNLPPQQLYILALSYMKAKEDEKAASLLTTLTGLEDLATFKTAQNYVLTGTVWYRLKNYKLAEQYMDDALKLPENKDSLPYQARARLWKAVLARKAGKDMKVQHWLAELVDHHPYSVESEWINPGFAGEAKGDAHRAPAHHSSH